MTIYVFGYGTLINRHLKNYIKEFDNYDRIIIPTFVYNLQRHWILASNNNIYLGIYDKLNYKTNGLLIEVNEYELERLDKREKYYIRKEINKNRIENILDAKDIVYTYYSDEKTTQRTLFNKFSRQNLKYLIVCLSGCIRISKQFLFDFILMTHG